MALQQHEGCSLVIGEADPLSLDSLLIVWVASEKSTDFNYTVSHVGESVLEARENDEATLVTMYKTIGPNATDTPKGPSRLVSPRGLVWAYVTDDGRLRTTFAAKGEPYGYIWVNSGTALPEGDYLLSLNGTGLLRLFQIIKTGRIEVWRAPPNPVPAETIPPYRLFVRDDGALELWATCKPGLKAKMVRIWNSRGTYDPSWHGSGGPGASLHPLTSVSPKPPPPPPKQTPPSVGAVSWKAEIQGSSIIFWATNSGTNARHCRISFTLDHTEWDKPQPSRSVAENTEVPGNTNDWRIIYRWDTTWAASGLKMSNQNVIWLD